MNEQTPSVCPCTMDHPEDLTLSPAPADPPEEEAIASLPAEETCADEGTAPEPVGTEDEEPRGEDPDRGSGASEDVPDPIEAPADPLPDPSIDQGSLGSLRQELTDLREKIARERAAFERMSRECAEFRALYPDIPLSALPDSVWTQVENGVPVAAAFALSERKRIRAAEEAEKSNRENLSRSAGGIRCGEKSYFSPAEVRAMSPGEVRENYREIMLSMPHWNT